MAQVVLATRRPAVEEELSEALLATGHAVATVASWAALVQAVATPDTKLVLLDGALPGADGPLLADLVATLSHKPILRTVQATLEPIEEAPPPGPQFRRLIASVAGPVVSADERKTLRLVGLGRRPLQALNRLARSPLPLLIEGERGTGKKHIAEAVHRLMGQGSFYELKRWNADSVPVAAGSSAPRTQGSLYVALADKWDAERVAEGLQIAKSFGLRLMVASRSRQPLEEGQWLHVLLSPLRDRREDLHELALHYINVHRNLVGFPRRRFGKSLWALIYAYAWPSNARELESFVATTLASVERSLIHARNLPDQVRDMIDPKPDRALLQAAEAFETTVEDRLRHVVRLYANTGGDTLNQMVIDGTQRPLFRLALARAGNQKAAAELLGLARNTLRAHMKRLGLDDPGASGRNR